MEIGGSVSLEVSNGEGGCEVSDDHEFGDLTGAYLDYNGRMIDLNVGGGTDECGPRNHGISCQFDLAD